LAICRPQWSDSAKTSVITRETNYNRANPA
jgi:hypothetical protein